MTECERRAASALWWPGYWRAGTAEFVAAVAECMESWWFVAPGPIQAYVATERDDVLAWDYVSERDVASQRPRPGGTWR